MIATVYGPREPQLKGKILHDRAIVNCEYSMAAFSTGEHKKTKTDRYQTYQYSIVAKKIILKKYRRSQEISMLIKQTFESVILCTLAPRSQIDIYITVIQADGGINYFFIFFNKRHKESINYFIIFNF